MNHFGFNTMRTLLITAFNLFLFTFSANAQNAESLPAGMHVYGATDSIETIHAGVVYYVPFDGEPLLDWRERVEYHMRRAQKFHQREFSGQSNLIYSIYPSPFIASTARDGFPKDDVNKFYWHIINEVWHSGKIQFKPDCFPIVLVLSDINFAPGYDDWTRVYDRSNGFFEPPYDFCDGYIRGDGEDRPGSRCGGSRSVFWPEMHIGLGLVTADGWRVPIKGTDCVVYHEGLGHAIGLPHPEPIDNSVMGLAQYEDSIEKTWIHEGQKKSLGWLREGIDHTDLFSTFDVSHSPIKPSPQDQVTITASFNSRYKIKKIIAEVQTALREPFQFLGKGIVKTEKGFTRVSWIMKPLESNQSAAYRVRIETMCGEREELWHYYKVRP